LWRWKGGVDRLWCCEGVYGREDGEDDGDLDAGICAVGAVCGAGEEGGIHGHLCFGGDFVLLVDGSSSRIGGGQDVWGRVEGCAGDKWEGEQAGRRGGDEGDGDESRRETAKCSRVQGLTDRQFTPANYFAETITNKISNAFSECNKVPEKARHRRKR
jgi:hypothetical protein